MPRSLHEPDPDAPAARAAVLFAESAMRALATRADFRAALCGGAPLAAMLAALQRLPALRRMAWRDVHLFAVDDGWDEVSTHALSTLGLPRGNLHRPRSADIEPVDAARHYEQTLRAHFGLRAGELPVFDFVLLHAWASGRLAGRGANDNAAIDVARLVVVQPHRPPRLALGIDVINAARQRVLICDSPQAPQLEQLNPACEVQVLAPSTARSSGAVTPATVRASRSSLPPS